MKPIIKLTKEQRDTLINEIRQYFLMERDQELGELAAGLLLDFFIEKIGPEIYNQGVYDSYNYMTDKLEDLLGIQK